MKKILILSSNPRNDLKLDREIKDLQNIIKRSKNQSQFDIEFKPEVRPEELQDLFLEHEPQIVHFCGYGTGVRGLVLQNSAGEEQLVSIDALSNLFQLFENSCECVLLDGCYSEIQANAIAKYINYTIGISYETRDDTGIPQRFAKRYAFTTGFYRALGWGKSIEESYQFGCNAIQIQIAKANNSRSSKSKASQQMLAVDVAEPIIISEDLKPVLKKKQLLTSFTESATSALSGNDPDSSTTPDLSSQLMAALEVEEGYKQYRELTRETWDEFGQTSFVAREPISKNEYRQRTTLLSKVKKIWIEDFLKPSLSGNAAINLNWKYSLQSVKLPFEAIELDESFEELKTTDILNQTGQGKTFLILGEPGSGKTIALLQLTERLVTQIEQDLTKPISVVFNLSSWGQKPQSIEKWLIEELKDKYQVPQRCSEPWLKQQQLILLLDGLDEVRADRRDACVRALNQFIATHNITEMVICSRIKDYEALTERLQLSSAICIKPLSSEQVSSFLTKAGDSLAGLKTLLQRDRELAQFAQTPLILNIMSMAYRGWSAEKLLQQFRTSEDRYRHLFDSYIKRMLNRRVMKQLTQNSNSTQYPQEKVLNWLSWLAKQLSDASQTVFLIEKIQPTWLPKDYQKLLYAIGVGWTVGLTAAIFHVAQLSIVFGGGLGQGLKAGVIAGLSYGVLGGFISRLLNGIVARLAMGLTLGITFGLAFYSILGKDFGLSYGLFYTICGFLIYEFFSEDIKLVDTLKWSWHKALKNWWLGVIFVLILTVTNEVLFGLIFGLLLWLILGREKQTKISKTTKPNQGIWKSVQNTIEVAVIIGLGSGILTGVIHCGISIKAIPSSIPITKNSLVFGLANGIMFGYAAALLSTQGAGFVGLKHLMLRFLLWRSGRIPWNYARFLDYASERLLMKKVGGGYVFYHRMLMEHFAQRNRVSREPVPVTPRETLQPVVQTGTNTTVRSSNINSTVTSTMLGSSNTVQERFVCGNCGHQNRANAKFCSKCGKRITQNT